MMMKLYIALLAASLLLLSGCGNKPKPGEDDTLTSGTITIAVDETFRPIIEEELQVFHALTPDATVHPIYCSEVEAMKLLLADSVRLAITTQQLTKQETAYLNDKKFFPVSVKMATDGLALIVNKQNTDSLITVDQFKEILTGKVTDWKQLNPASRLGELQLVFDNPNSSTVHYVLDSICGGMPLSKDLKAQKTNPEVISYVAKNPAALGVIGVNWIGNPADSTRLSFNDAIRIMAVSRADSATVENSFRPYQAYLALNQYPLTRSVYILLNDPKSAQWSDFFPDRFPGTAYHLEIRTGTCYGCCEDCRCKRGIINEQKRRTMKKLVLTVMSLCLAVTMWGQTPAGSEWSPQVKQAATMIKENPAKASEAFDELMKGKNKKNTSLLVEIGRAYLDQGKTAEAAEYAQRAKDVNSKCAVAYLLSGDVALKLNDVNKASSDYNQAIYLDENCSEAYFKYAQVYKGVDPQLSLDMLMRLQTKAPDDNRISKELADVYYTMGQYGKAKEAYESYLKVGTPTEQDYTRYATLLYLNKDYAQSSDMVKKGLELAPENHVLKRLAMYDNLELKDYKEGLEAAATFFSNPGNPDYVYLDYVYFARLLEADKQYDEAVAQFDKALAMDKSHTEIYKDISDVYEKERDFPKAIEAYKNYLGGMKGDPDISDLFLYGRLNYYAATDSAYQDKQPLYLAEADTIFAQVAAKVPDNYLGNFWRARVNSLRDPETTQGLAKPYYEAALSILEQKPDATKSVLVECNSYLGYYYFVKEDYNQSKLYWNKILEIDPGNETATKALGGIK